MSCASGQATIDFGETADFDRFCGFQLKITDFDGKPQNLQKNMKTAKCTKNVKSEKTVKSTKTMKSVKSTKSAYFYVK